MRVDGGLGGAASQRSICRCYYDVIGARWFHAGRSRECAVKAAAPVVPSRRQRTRFQNQRDNNAVKWMRGGCGPGRRTLVILALIRVHQSCIKAI